MGGHTTRRLEEKDSQVSITNWTSQWTSRWNHLPSSGLTTLSGSQVTVRYRRPRNRTSWKSRGGSYVQQWTSNDRNNDYHIMDPDTVLWGSREDCIKKSSFHIAAMNGLPDIYPVHRRTRQAFGPNRRTIAWATFVGTLRPHRTNTDGLGPSSSIRNKKGCGGIYVDCKDKVSPPMDIGNLRGVTSALSPSWVRIGYLMEGAVPPLERSLVERNLTMDNCYSSSVFNKGVLPVETVHYHAAAELTTTCLYHFFEIHQNMHK
ncbi:hypothetical protein EVAR_17690_1 [Eumeta japonica]|uniref:Uncharacterized protein n=1 Tax=Eumeta variegata TaxID=151549 RepID=A0A4C1UT32_EUMVA|nr:hypothetical protein EVAR_17690_1 [Eumeta japonica]